ncbi:MAG: hypothetical protein HRU27_12860 [Rhizobiaceae bacterium]|nr:hypothetical protein [Rhizobiaceae bacterium]
MQAKLENTSEKTDAEPAFSILASELAKIAVEVEALSDGPVGELTQKRMVALQNIDFCSQRLNDLADLLRHLNSEFETQPDGLNERLSQKARLEHNRDLFAGWVEY